MNNPITLGQSILYGKPIARQILAGVTRQVEELKEREMTPCLMTIELGADPATKIYLESQRKAARKAGINYESIELSQGTSQYRLLKIIQHINRDPSINGLIVHLPLPEHLDSHVVQWSIDIKKDVEGVTPHNLGRLFLGVEGLNPCTAEAIVALIKSTGVDLKGKEVTIVGHSQIVGKPAAILLLKEEATVTVCHQATSERGMLEQHVRNAEVLVVAVGKPNLIKGEWIKEGAIVIDAGINKVEDGIVGDVEFEAARERARFITPVPGGVGSVTVAYLMKNTLTALQWQMKDSSR